MRRTLPFLTALLVLLPAGVRAQFAPPEPALGGYVKTLALAYDRPEARLFLDRGGRLFYSRFRLEGRLPLGRDLSLHGAAELEDYVGEGAGSFLLQRGGRGDAAWTPEWVLTDQEDLRTRLFLDRFYLEAYSGRWTLTLGKQRVAWGSGQFWNPTDLFDPFGPLSLDPEDRPGSDALRVDYQLGPVSVLTGVVSVGAKPSWYEDTRDRSVQALRLRTHLGDWDIAVLAAQDRGDGVAGLDITGYVGDAGVYLESAVVRHPGLETITAEGGGTLTLRTGDHDTWLEAAAGGSYGLESGWTIRGEVFFNGGGAGPWEGPDGLATPLTRYDWRRVARGDILAPARLYAAGFTSWQLTPLITPELGVLANLSDGGLALLPGLDWSVLSDLRLTAGAQVYLAETTDEFSYYPLSGYLLLKYSF
ncbi:MAG: hypothetical protein R6W82_06665 [bacterium]